jgi:hypothetical protein
MIPPFISAVVAGELPWKRLLAEGLRRRTAIAAAPAPARAKDVVIGACVAKDDRDT